MKAEGWDADTSTPVIAHIEGADGEVDFYTAIDANKQVTVKVGKSGTYTVTFISPVTPTVPSTRCHRRGLPLGKPVRQPPQA